MKKHRSHEHSQGTAHHSDAHHGRKKDANMQKAVTALALVFLAIAAYNLYLIYSSNIVVSEKIAASNEAARPANIGVTKILAQNCQDCFDITQIEGAVGQLNVKAENKILDYASEDAKQLISKYNIKKIPTMLITGEVDKAGISFWNQVGTKETDGTLVLRYGAPFIDPSSGTEFGKAQLVNIIDNSCASCYNVSIQENILKEGFGFAFSGIKTYVVNSAEGARLVSLYNITKVPTIIISADAKYYDINDFQGIWKQVGTIEKDDSYVFRNMQALRGITYKDLILNKTVNATA